MMNSDPRIDSDVTKCFPKLTQSIIDFVISGNLLNKASDEEKFKAQDMKFIEKLNKQFESLLKGMDTKPEISFEKLLPLFLED